MLEINCKVKVQVTTQAISTYLHVYATNVHEEVAAYLLARVLNPLNAQLNPICHLLALLGVHNFLHVSRIRVKSLSLRLLMAYIYIYIYIYMEHLFLMFLDHTQRRTTVDRTPLDEWSARRRDLYLTTHNTHNRQISMPPVAFEPTISAGERPQFNSIQLMVRIGNTEGLRTWAVGHK